MTYNGYGYFSFFSLEKCTTFSIEFSSHSYNEQDCNGDPLPVASTTVTDVNLAENRART